MIESQRRGQAACHRIAKLGVRKHRFGINVHRVQHREQQQRLRLAVAIADVPCLRGHLRHIIAAVHAHRQIADLVLHELQGFGGAFERVGRRGLDRRHFGGERAVVRDGAGRRV